MSNVTDISDARAIRAKTKTIPQDIAETMVVGEMFANCATLNLCALYLLETGRPAEGGMLHALILEIQQVAKRLSRNFDVPKAH